MSGTLCPFRVLEQQVPRLSVSVVSLSEMGYCCCVCRAKKMPILSNAQNGTLITWSVPFLLINYPNLIPLALDLSTIPVKQLILHLNKRTPFVIRDLDDTHVFIDNSYVDFVNSQIDELLEKNIWDAAAAHSK
jgi:TFIIH basal transcription factor complex TTD-A subunit